MEEHKNKIEELEEKIEKLESDLENIKSILDIQDDEDTSWEDSDDEDLYN